MPPQRASATTQAPRKRRDIPVPSDIAQLRTCTPHQLKGHWPSKWGVTERSAAYGAIRSCSGWKRTRDPTELSLCHFADEQDPQHWREYCKKVIEKIPDLRRYKDDWFIQVLWDRFVLKLKKSKSEQHNSEIARKHEESSTALNGVLYIGKPQAHHRPKLESGTQLDYSASLWMKPSTSQLMDQKDDLILLGPSDTVEDALHASAWAGNASSHPTSHRSVSTATLVSHAPVSLEWPPRHAAVLPAMPCAMCDFRPAIEPEDRKELEKLFYNVHGAAQLLQVLSAAGIYHDGHVAVMRGWMQEQRMMLWEELVARDAITPLTMLALEGLFSEETFDTDGAVATGTIASRTQQWTIARDQEMIDIVVDSTICDSFFRKAMGIDEEEYASFRSTVESYAHILRAEYYPEDQNEQDWEMVVKAIMRDIPTLAEYEALWPVEAMLRRIINENGHIQRAAGEAKPAGPFVHVRESASLTYNCSHL
ncbi:hypothetical protein FB107DRAFT_260122, partial [Schizophyllum commune]